MKRHPALARLSRDHHHALVLARRLTRVGDQPSVQVWSAALELRRRFVSELDPHFVVEEEVLLPACMMRTVPLRSLARAVRDDHEEMRILLMKLHDADRARAILPAFGELLARHVRLEERELFEEIQLSFAPAELDALVGEMERTARAVGM